MLFPVAADAVRGDGREEDVVVELAGAVSQKAAGADERLPLARGSDLGVHASVGMGTSYLP